jgi:phospholipid N-methyltransferase
MSIYLRDITLKEVFKPFVQANSERKLRQGQFQHSLLGRKKIRTRFPNLRTVLVFLNFPPAAVYHARPSSGRHEATLAQEKKRLRAAAK